jgi:lysozyme
MALADRLLQNEGLRLTVYDDYNGKAIQPGSQVIGKPTIGIGTLICAPGGLTQAEAQMLCNNRIAIAAAAVSTLVPGLQQSDPVRFDVLTEMAFWIGGTGLSGFKTMLKYVTNRDYDGAASALLSSKLHSQVPRRCETLAETLRSGQATS